MATLHVDPKFMWPTPITLGMSCDEEHQYKELLLQNKQEHQYKELHKLSIYYFKKLWNIPLRFCLSILLISEKFNYFYTNLIKLAMNMVIFINLLKYFNLFFICSSFCLSISIYQSEQFIIIYLLISQLYTF